MLHLLGLKSDVTKICLALYSYSSTCTFSFSKDFFISFFAASTASSFYLFLLALLKVALERIFRLFSEDCRGSIFSLLLFVVFMMRDENFCFTKIVLSVFSGTSSTDFATDRTWLLDSAIAEVIPASYEPWRDNCVCNLELMLSFYGETPSISYRLTLDLPLLI